jgi:hypothetical protein
MTVPAPDKKEGVENVKPVVHLFILFILFCIRDTSQRKLNNTNVKIISFANKFTT